MAHKPLSFDFPEGLPHPLVPEPAPLSQRRRRSVPFPRQRGRILREIDPVSEHYVAEERPARHHLQNGMKTHSKKLPSWFSTKEGSRSLNGTIFSTKITLFTITKNRICHLRPTA